ncbi:MAG: dUTPase [Candidatus Nitrosocosmicus sp.]|jgi:dimeric dUTPase (all-alpha-NTP-PPase superfamily)|uniref:dUTPase n=1 Tax=Candidatus Nitrosocosmicus agrestis TaxID=2563600 RepID=UPI001916D88E|nr:dUTPase [Candidatus Nitrosocosmicus sp. SS]MDR4492397.1 dUTPase [Candidatus Nitrosocosmicus sp.]
MARELNSDDVHTDDREKKPSDDKLDLLFQKQKALISQELDSSNRDNNKKVENKMKRLYQVKEPFQGYRIFMLSSALLHETVELQRETDWKWWKSDKGVDHQKIVEEIIDLWHFLIQLSIEAGIDPDLLVTKYMQKNRENTKRQESGY